MIFLEQVVQSLPVVVVVAQLIAQLKESVEAALVGGVEEGVFEGVAEEGGDVVPVVLNQVQSGRQAGVPVLLQFGSEDVELLVVDVLIDSGAAFQTVNNEFETDLRVCPADRYVILLKRTKGLSFHLHALSL